MDILSPEQRRRCMQSNKSSGTKPELAMGRLLWSAGIRYRKHPKDIPGRPDFCIRKYKLAIFVDGEFWHGRDWQAKKSRLKGNRDFWIRKIERNIKRDIRVSSVLNAAGWKVFRFWESDIRKHPGVCLREVMLYMSRFNGFEAPEYIPADFAGYSYDKAAEEAQALAAEPPAEYL